MTAILRSRSVFAPSDRPAGEPYPNYRNSEFSARYRCRLEWSDAHFMERAQIATFGDDCVGGELAHLELRPLGLVLGLRFVVPNRGVLVPWEYRAAFGPP